MQTLIRARMASCTIHARYTKACQACRIQNRRYYRWYRRVNGQTKSDYIPCNIWVDCKICYPD